MDMFLMAGTALGGMIGLLHAPLIYRQRRDDEGATPARAAYFATWALALWTLFGASVLAFWLIGAAGMTVSRLTRRSEQGG